VDSGGTEFLIGGSPHVRRWSTSRLNRGQGLTPTSAQLQHL
jgi:hypothetical protein